jgi:hypothetical protein
MKHISYLNRTETQREVSSNAALPTVAGFHQRVFIRVGEAQFPLLRKPPIYMSGPSKHPCFNYPNKKFIILQFSPFSHLSVFLNFIFRYLQHFKMPSSLILSSVVGIFYRILGLKRDEVTGEWRKLHSEELHSLY